MNVGLEKKSLRVRLGCFIESLPVQKFIIGLIIVNAITLGLETSDSIMQRYGDMLHLFDTIILSVFVLEIVLKLFAYDWRFFKSAWNIFDFIIIVIALLPSSGALSVLRTLRVLRILRLISVMPQLRFVVEALLHSLPGIGSIAGLMIVIYYVFAVMATGLFGEAFPQWFGTIGHSMYTLFQVMTLESWSMGIARPVMQVYPYAWMFFLPFILLATFTILNLFIAIIVNTMQTLHDKSKAEPKTDKPAQDEASLMQELQAVKQEVLVLQSMLQQREK